MRFPQNVIEAFVYDQFKEYKIKESRNGTEICINGPFEPDKRFRMYINVEKNLVHDFNTGYSNTFLGFVADYLDLSIREAKTLIIKTYLNYKAIKEVIQPYKTPIKTIELEEINEPPGLEKINSKTEYGRLAMRLLYEKNISPEIVKKFKLRVFTSGYYEGRLYIPFYMNKKLVFFQARDLLGKEEWLKRHKRNKKYVKYLNPKGIPKSQIVFNYDSIKEGSEVIIIEGPFDAMTIKGGVAILGNTISRAQAKKIADKRPSKIIFIPDNDKAGKETLEKNLEIMKEVAPNIEVGYYELDSKYKDVNEANLKQLNPIKVKKDPKIEQLKNQLATAQRDMLRISAASLDINKIRRKIIKYKIL